jgi:hypothetical protein
MGETLGCQRTKKQALEFGESMGYSRYELNARWVEVDVTAETVRLLLGNHGGYATAQSAD